MQVIIFTSTPEESLAITSVCIIILLFLFEFNYNLLFLFFSCEYQLNHLANRNTEKIEKKLSEIRKVKNISKIKIILKKLNFFIYTLIETQSYG